MENLIDDQPINKYREHHNNYMKTKIMCDECGEYIKRANMTIHKKCKIHEMKKQLYNLKTQSAN
jgi:hypothetical protein